MLTPDTLRRRRLRLIDLRARIDAELDALERGMRAAGVLPLGRPTRMPTITTAEARRAHAAYVRGIRTPEVVEGNRQYNRDNARQIRARRRSA